MTRFVNLACGSTFVDSVEWLNIDFVATHPSVKQGNLLGFLPIESASHDVVYCSHFLEHIPRHRVGQFLAECARILRPGGVLRLVTPDLEAMAREYVAMLDNREFEHAQVQEFSIVDQCVRMRPGGELAVFYGDLGASGSSDLKAYVSSRTGVDLSEYSDTDPAFRARLTVPAVITRLRFAVARRVLPRWAAEGNLSLTTPGERHQWLWSEATLSRALAEAGFGDICVVDQRSSRVPSFPLEILDMDEDHRPRKGLDSIFVEAVRL